MKDGIVAHHPGDDQARRRRASSRSATSSSCSPATRKPTASARNKGATEWLDLLGHPEFGLNADGGGGGFNPDGSPAGFTMQTAEKTFAGYTLTVRNRGGHSSKPRKDNAIYSLAHALDKLEAYRFTPMLNETTRAYFDGTRRRWRRARSATRCARWLANPERRRGRRRHRGERERSRADPHALRRRRGCSRGHADNALPQLATAMVNCRIFPGVDPNAVKAELERIVADPKSWSRATTIMSPRSPRRCGPTSPAPTPGRCRRSTRACRCSRRCRPARATRGRSGSPESRSTAPTAAGCRPDRRPRPRQGRAAAGPVAVRQCRPLGDDAARPRRAIGRQAVAGRRLQHLFGVAGTLTLRHALSTRPSAPIR